MKKRQNGCYSPYLCMEGLLVSYLRVIGKILMQKIIFVLILLSAHFTFANYAYADNAEVLSYPSSCDYFIANGNRGYYLFQWHGGYEPSEGDIILGDINSNGFKDVYFPLKERESRVYVEDYSMSESRAFEHYNEHCNS